MSESEVVTQSQFVPEDMAGKRLDQVAAKLFPDFSRSRLQEWIKDAKLTVDGRQAKTRDKLIGGETLLLEVELEPQGEWQAEDIPIDIVYEDEHILVLNKPVGLVVHPAAGNYSGTLLNALLFHDPEQIKIPRCGIVHRLDKDTSGLMVVAKTLAAQTDLVAQLQERSVSREYEAIAMGEFTGGGVVDEPIGRHPRQRTKMAVVPEGLDSGKEAITHYRIIERFAHHTHIRLKLETGRTHQIRVHMAHIQRPLVGDTTYAGRFKIPKGASRTLIEALRDFPRQALHAAQLGLIHPATGEYCEWQAPLPKDIQELLELMATDSDD